MPTTTTKTCYSERRISELVDIYFAMFESDKYKPEEFIQKRNIFEERVKRNGNLPRVIERAEGIEAKFSATDSMPGYIKIYRMIPLGQSEFQQELSLDSMKEGIHYFLYRIVPPKVKSLQVVPFNRPSSPKIVNKRRRVFA